MPFYLVTLERRRTIVETATVTIEASSSNAATYNGADFGDPDWTLVDDQLDWQGVADVEHL